MIRRPPRSTRTDTLFPYTPLFRSLGIVRDCGRACSTTPRGSPIWLRSSKIVLLLWLFEPRAIVSTLWKTLSRSEEHTSELQSLMRISYAVFCLKKKINNQQHPTKQHSQVKHHSLNLTYTYVV